MSQSETKQPTIALVGGGRMGRALIDGMTAAGVVSAERVSVVEPDPTAQKWWQDNHPGCRVSADVASAIKHADVVILAVKPDVVVKVAREGGSEWRGRLVLSVAAGISLAKLTPWFGGDRVIRVMPNTPCLVGKGASAFCCSPDVTAQDRELTRSMLSAVGWAEEVDEKLMDAVTGLSGSGPAYVCVAIEALADGGVWLDYRVIWRCDWPPKPCWAPRAWSARPGSILQRSKTRLPVPEEQPLPVCVPWNKMECVLRSSRRWRPPVGAAANWVLRKIERPVPRGRCPETHSRPRYPVEAHGFTDCQSR